MTILVLDTTRIGVFFRENYPFLRGFKLYHYLHEFSQVSPPKKKITDSALNLHLFLEFSRLTIPILHKAICVHINT